jgi:hypothetical protein
VETTVIKERPILFSGPMVRAILEGRKTQTRRVLDIEKALHDDANAERILEWREQNAEWFGLCEYDTLANCKCPYGQPGERLWVREAWARIVVGNQIDYLYRADTHAGLEKRDGDQKWKPSIHMPRVACRLMLEITGVRVERLSEISFKDAIAEGIEVQKSETFGDTVYRNYTPGQMGMTKSAVYSYMTLWQSINGPGSWDANPWVWVVEFKRV